jgi:hypothetical protein
MSTSRGIGKRVRLRPADSIRARPSRIFGTYTPSDDKREALLDDLASFDLCRVSGAEVNRRGACPVYMGKGAAHLRRVERVCA